MTFRVRNLMGNVRLTFEAPAETHSCCAVCTVPAGRGDLFMKEGFGKLEKKEKLQAAELDALHAQMHGLIQAEL